jgi:hypothetical protein
LSVAASEAVAVSRHERFTSISPAIGANVANPLSVPHQSGRGRDPEEDAVVAATRAGDQKGFTALHAEITA